MPSRLTRSLLSATVALAAVVAAAPAAQAIPLLGIGASAGAFGGAFLGGPGGLAYDVDASAQALGFDVAGTYLGSSAKQLLEVGLRSELSFLPMLSVKPMVGYQAQSFFGSALDHAPLVRLDLGFSPILSPVWFEATGGASYPLALGKPVIEYSATGYFALLPVASVGLRYRGFQVLNTTGSDFGSIEAGLRVNI